jgi:hypothetical protein
MRSGNTILIDRKSNTCEFPKGSFFSLWEEYFNETGFVAMAK